MVTYLVYSSQVKADTMKTIATRTVYYPRFEVGCTPQVAQCEVSIVECLATPSTGETRLKRFLRTPFAFLDHEGDTIDDCHIRGYFTTAEDCQKHLDASYPNWQLAAPLMACWETCRRYYGYAGNSEMERRTGVSSDEVGNLTRGQKSIKIKRIKQALQALKQYNASKAS